MKNVLKEKLKAGQVATGTFVGLGHPDVTEVLSGLGYDWLVIDGEHAPTGLETMQRMMQSMDSSKCTPIVRPQWNDMVIIKRVLDIGAHGVLVPWVNNREQAEYAVQACKYPPQGLRGFGPRRASLFDREYAKTANDEVMVVVQIETKEAVDNVDDILSVAGVDGCYIGPMDLAYSLGFTAPEWDNPRYAEAFDKVLAAASKRGKPAGLYATQGNIEWAVEKGFRLNTVDSDDTFLFRAARAALRQARGSK